MKTDLKMMLLMAIAVLSCALTSCDGDKDNDDLDNPITTQSKRLSRITIEEYGETSRFSEAYTFTYDGEGNLKVIDEEYSSSYANSSYSYKDDFFVTFQYDPFGISIDGEKVVCELSKDGFLTSTYSQYYPSEKTTYQYDNVGRIIKKHESDSDREYVWDQEIEYIWDNNGNLTNTVENWTEMEYSGKETSKISYSKDRNISGIWPVSFWKGCWVMDFLNMERNCPMALQFGFFGKAPEYFPEKIVVNSDEKGASTFNISHELNNDGTLKSEIIEEVYYGSEVYNTNYIISYHYEN